MAIITNRIHSTHVVMDKWEKIGIDRTTNRWVYNIISREIVNWIENQPIHMWKYYDISDELRLLLPIGALLGAAYLFTSEMDIWFKLRWQ